jgi:predicted RNA-binding protein YlxR (DUF448 family)
MKKIPMRTCVITGEKLPKKELIRVVRTPEGNVVVDESGKTNGRGAYLKKDIQTFEKAEKTKILDRKLEVEVPSSIYEELKNKVGV